MTSLNTINKLKTASANNEAQTILDDLKTTGIAVLAYLDDHADLSDQQKEDLTAVIGGIAIQAAAIESAISAGDVSEIAKLAILESAKNTVKEVNSVLFKPQPAEA